MDRVYTACGVGEWVFGDEVKSHLQETLPEHARGRSCAACTSARAESGVRSRSMSSALTVAERDVCKQTLVHPFS